LFLLIRNSETDPLGLYEASQTDTRYPVVYDSA